MASIEVESVGSATSDNKYQLSWQVLHAVDMPTEIFVHTYPQRQYSHVADPSDLPAPVVPMPNAAIYRASTAVMIFDDIVTAEQARSNVKDAIQDLVDAFNAGLPTFVIPQVEVFT